MDFEKWWLCVGKKCGSEDKKGRIKKSLVKLIAKSAWDNGEFHGELKKYKETHHIVGRES